MNGYTPICHAKLVAIANATNILTKDRLEKAFHAPAIFNRWIEGTSRNFCSLACAAIASRGG